METYTMRQASASYNAGATDLTRRIEYDIEVVGRLPLLSLSQVAGTGPVVAETDVTADVEYNLSLVSAVVDTVDPTTVYNAPDSIYMNGRFKVVAQVSSLVSMNNAYLYYDKKFKDLLLISDLSSLGTDADSIHLSRRRFRIKAYLVGGFGGSSTAHTEQYVFAVSDKDPRVAMLEPNIVDTKTFMVRLNAQDNNHINRMGVNFGVYYMESQTLPSVSMSAIGSTATFFGGPCQIYKPVRTSNKYDLVYLGNQEAQMLSFIYPW